ncbi:MAG: hypothetical protein ACRDPB_03935 [Nocardioidaceae bacterium]
MRMPACPRNLAAVTVLLALTSVASTSCTGPTDSGPPRVTVSPIRFDDPPPVAPRRDRAVVHRLEAVGLMRVDVETVGHVALRDGYLENASYNQAETFALAAVKTCDRIHDGSRWQTEVDHAVSAGATHQQAADMVRYLRVGFCPLLSKSGG